MKIRFKDNLLITEPYQAFSLFNDLNTLVFYTKKGVFRKVFQLQIQFKRDGSALKAYKRICEALEMGKSSVDITTLGCTMSDTLVTGIMFYNSLRNGEAWSDDIDDEDMEDELEEDLEEDPEDTFTL